MLRFISFLFQVALLPIFALIALRDYVWRWTTAEGAAFHEAQATFAEEVALDAQILEAEDETFGSYESRGRRVQADDSKTRPVAENLAFETDLKLEASAKINCKRGDAERGEDPSEEDARPYGL